MSEQTEACEVTRAVVKEQLQARKGELDWDNVPRLVPIALPRPVDAGRGAAGVRLYRAGDVRGIS